MISNSTQGSPTTNEGAPVDGTVSMTLALYASLTGGTALWSVTLSVPVTNGIYRVTLGTTPGNPLDNTLSAFANVPSVKRSPIN